MHIVLNKIPNLRMKQVHLSEIWLSKQCSALSVYYLVYLNGFAFSSMFSCWVWLLSGLELSILMWLWNELEISKQNLLNKETHRHALKNLIGSSSQDVHLLTWQKTSFITKCNYTIICLDFFGAGWENLTGQATLIASSYTMCSLYNTLSEYQFTARMLRPSILSMFSWSLSPAVPSQTRK